MSNQHLVADVFESEAERTGRFPFGHRTVQFAVALSDVGTVAAASVAAQAVYHALTYGAVRDLGAALHLGSIAGAVLVIWLQREGGYGISEILDFGRQARRIAFAWTSLLALFLAATFALKAGTAFSRGAVLTFAALAPAALLGERLIWRAVCKRALATGAVPGRKVALIGRAEQLANQAFMASLDRSGYEVTRVVAVGEGAEDGCDPHDLAQRALAAVRGTQADEILIIAGTTALTHLAVLRDRFRATPLPVHLVPDTSLAGYFQNSRRTIGSAIAITLQSAPLTEIERALKRGFDCAIALLAIVLSAPLLAAVAFAVKLDSPGPVLFRQTRHGFNGRPFRILKFRTMSVMEDGAVVTQATRGDSRVTRIGRILRRTSLDELPQLFNVVAGDMSLVGPRPHAVAHDTHYEKLIGSYAQRHHVKPGLTGWAQVNGFRGETPTLECMEQRIEFDLWYVDHWSLWLDLKIVMKTAWLLLRPNAY